ncbi:MAG: radical SAM protein [Crenarchaeota archaeon]|nr:radical SAM protein [Thermoproteota archaeon]
MIIRFKTIENERKDAPFIGALISAVWCNFNCKDCINEHLKDNTYQEMDSYDIIEYIKRNPFNKGIILGGLEWTLQYSEMHELVKKAKEHELQTMVYTGLDFNTFQSKYNDVLVLTDYIKCGRYIEDFITNDNWQYGIKLATSNQKIYKKGIDY